MSTQAKTLKFFRTVSILAVALFWLAGQTLVVQAAPPSLVLMINGVTTPANIINGSTIDITWDISGSVTNCLIKENTIDSNGLPVSTIIKNNIDVSVLPAIGGMPPYTPPLNSSANYELQCDGVGTGVSVNTNTPTVTMSIDEGNSLQVNPLTGIVDQVTVRWSSQNTDSCSIVRREKASAPIPPIFENSSIDYTGMLAPSGSLVFDGSPRGVAEDTTFYIDCTNNNTGTTVTGSTYLAVANPVGIGIPDVVLTSPNAPNVIGDPVYGYAFVTLDFVGQNVSRCYQSAQDVVNSVSYNPPGWSLSSAITSSVVSNVKIAVTTDFTITCTRDAMTVGGTFYPAATVTDTLRISFVPAAVDRTTIPPVTVTVTADQNPVTKNSNTGKAVLTAGVIGSNTDYCVQKAYKTTGTLAEYFLTNWTGTVQSDVAGDVVVSGAVKLTETTRLYSECFREYDLVYGNAAELANGSDAVSLVVTVLDWAGVIFPPRVSVYGNAVKLDASDMWNNKTSSGGFVDNFGAYVPRLENTTVIGSSNFIEFPFPYAAGKMDNFDIYLQMCDENDGVSDFKVYVNNVLSGNYQTNSATAPLNWCGDSTLTDQKIADDIDITEGDTIRVECDTGNDGEYCRLGAIYFGVDDIAITPVSISSTVLAVNSPVMWFSDNVSRCYGADAVKADGSTYSWSGSAAISYLDLTNFIDMSTDFSVTCIRDSDGLLSTNLVQVTVPVDAAIVSSVLAASGECFDDGTFGGNFGDTITAPPGYGPDPVSGVCVPLIDLKPEALSFGVAGAAVDNVAGTYNNIPISSTIRNLGPGDMPANSDIPYKFDIDFDPALSVPYSSSVYLFTGALVANTASGNLIQSVASVPFGDYTLCSRVNLDGTISPVEDPAKKANNQTILNGVAPIVPCTTGSLPVPQPPMGIVAEPNIIRPNQPFDLAWNINVTYRLNCTVKGPGGVNVSFDTLVVGPGYFGSVTINTLTHESEYLFQCTEPITGTTFTEIVRVEMIPVAEEF